MVEPVRPWISRTLWAGTLFLALVGVTAGVFRATFVSDAGARAQPIRPPFLRTFGVVDPRIEERPAEVERYDVRYARRPALTLLHVVPGALFLAFAPLQFSSRLRRRYPRLHRVSGRGLLLLLAASTVPALYFGLFDPFAGGAEALTIAIVAALIVLSGARGFLAIRRGDVARHREWMLRAFALALGIGAVRVVGLLVDVILTPFGFGPAAVLLVSLWIGWALTVGVAELWILKTRPSAVLRQARHAVAAPL